MPAINFQSKFVSLIEQGLKRQTIRKLRKSNNIKLGDVLYLYTNQRTSNCRKIGQYQCKSVQQLSIFKELVSKTGASIHVVLLDGKEVRGSDLMKLISDDGFSNFSDFVQFFDYHYGLPFDGVLIKW